MAPPGREGQRALVADRAVLSVIHPLTQVLAGLEVRNVLAGERDGLAGLGIAPLAGRSKVQREAAKAANLDALTLGQGIAHDLQNLLQRELDVLGRQMLLLRRDDLDELRFRHGRSHVSYPSHLRARR